MFFLDFFGRGASSDEVVTYLDGRFVGLPLLVVFATFCLDCFEFAGTGFSTLVPELEFILVLAILRLPLL